MQHDGYIFVSGYYPVDAVAYSIPSFATITKDGTLHINSRTASDAGEYAFKVVAVDVDGNEASATVYLTATKQATYGTPRQQQDVGAAMHDIRCNEPLELYVRNGMTRSAYILPRTRSWQGVGWIWSRLQDMQV